VADMIGNGMRGVLAHEAITVVSSNAGNQQGVRIPSYGIVGSFKG
jgi:hypothetical protein